MASNSVYIKNPNNDFSLVQNYAIQLVAEKQITSSAFVLYAFYQSLNGFAEIRISYRYIQQNTGISIGNISKCNDLLEKTGLIHKVYNGWKKAFTIELASNSSIPRRTLKSLNCSSDEASIHDVNTNDMNCSVDKHIHRLQQDIADTNNTTTAPKPKLNTKKTVQKDQISFNETEVDFIDKFVGSWMIHTNSKYYTKGDFSAVKQIDASDAIKYIEVLWELDNHDKWVKFSDHSLSIFAKEYKSGRLQSLYPRTIFSKQAMPA